MVATALLMVVTAIVSTAMLQMRSSQRTISNRTAMHSGIRGATELLQQEVGQAGRVALPTGTVSLTTSPITKAAYCDGNDSSINAATINVTSTAGMFADMALSTLDGTNAETVRVNSIVNGTSLKACFAFDHAIGAKFMPLGGFATGVVPDSGIVNGSSGTVLKLYGDINADGNMVYVEYTCDYASRNLYRNVTSFTSASKPAVTNSNILLSNLVPNPDGYPCFKYQTAVVTVDSSPPTDFTFVLDVAVTLTVETEQVDPITQKRQQETKALLNVSPRNVFNAWEYASLGYSFRIQSTPVSVTHLL
jgi:hypothetical protein